MPTNTPTLLDNLKDSIPGVTIPSFDNLPIAPQIKTIDRTFDRFVDQVPNVMFNLSLGLLIIVLGWLLGGWVAVRLNRLLVRARMEETLAAFLASTARFALFFTFCTIALAVVGVSTTTMAALVGAIGIAVGFALRGTLGNVAGGIMLMVHRPFKVSDWIENQVGPVTIAGTVKRIGVFSTEVNTSEHIRVFIPNAMLWENNVQNHTYNRMRMLELTFGLAYGTDVRKAFEIVKTTLIANPLVLKNPEPMLGVDTFEKDGVMCKLDVWARTEDRRMLRDTVLIDVMEALHAADIRMAHEEALPDDDKSITDKPAEANGTTAQSAKDGNVPDKTNLSGKDTK